MRRAPALAMAVLLAASVPSEVTAGRSAPQSTTQAASRSLTVVQSVEPGRALLEIRGPEPEPFRIEVAPLGSLVLSFPGAQLVLDEAGNGPHPASLVAPDRLEVPATYHLVGIESRPGAVWVSLERTADATAAKAYQLGVGDKVRLNIYGDEEFRNKEMRILEDGTVSVPYLGDVRVAGLTVVDAAETISQRLGDGYLVEPKVSLEVVEYQSQWVNVSGQVETPGRYYLEGPTRLVDIIARAGGLKKEAGTEIKLVRPGTNEARDQVFTFTREALYLTDDPASNPVLRSGDTVTVSSEEYFYIRGEVKSPGRYALDADTTILKAISLAGGFEQYANGKKVELLRTQGDETVRLVINVERIQNRKADDVPILPGDVINVRARFL